MEPLKPKQKPHYVNNKDFSLAVVEYVEKADSARNTGEAIPKVTDYIATCFLKIAEGLSHKANFIRYTYREEMVMDAVENCLKAIGNYNIEAATRTGNPNAFAYFTQICYYAFLRRIAKEKKQQEVKFKFIEQSGIEEFMEFGDGYGNTGVEQQFVDELRSRIERVRHTDTQIKEFAKEEKAKEKAKKDEGLELFMG